MTDPYLILGEVIMSINMNFEEDINKQIEKINHIIKSFLENIPPLKNDLIYKITDDFIKGPNSINYRIVYNLLKRNGARCIKYYTLDSEIFLFKIPEKLTTCPCLFVIEVFHGLDYHKLYQLKFLRPEDSRERRDIDKPIEYDIGTYLDDLLEERVENLIQESDHYIKQLYRLDHLKRITKRLITGENNPNTGDRYDMSNL